MEDLYTLLGLTGRDIGGVDANILVEALTPSQVCTDNYEPYEFIGDSVLSLVVTQLMYNMGIKSPDKMTKIRSLITKNSTLACMVTGIGLDKRVYGGIRLNEKGRADIFEAIIGAIYIWAEAHLPNPMLSLTRWLDEHWNFSTLISNIVRDPDNIPLFSFMKPGDFAALSPSDARKQLLKEIELASTIKCKHIDILMKLKDSLCDDMEKLRSIKSQVYNVAMKM